MERLTVRCDFGLEEEVEQIGYNLPNVEERGFYSIYDLAKYSEDDVILKEMLGKTSLKLAEYEDTGLAPEEIKEQIEILEHNYKCMEDTLERQYDNARKLLDELEKECDCWKCEALKWASELGEQKIERGKNERS